jgi:hypothetical protein
VLAFLAAGLLFFVLLPGIVLGPSGWIHFHLQILAGSRGSEAATDINSQYMPRVLLRYFAGLLPAGPGPFVTRALQLLSLLVAAVNVGCLARFGRLPAADGIPLSAAALFLSLPFVVGTSWPHYFSYLPFCQALVLLYLLRSPAIGRTPRWVLLSLAGVSAAGSSAFVFDCFPTWSSYSQWGVLFVANAMLLPAIYSFARRAAVVVHHAAAGRTAAVRGID